MRRKKIKILTMCLTVFSFIILFKDIYNLLSINFSWSYPPSYPLYDIKGLLNALIAWSGLCIHNSIACLIMSKIDLGLDKRRNLLNNYSKVMFIINLVLVIVFIVLMVIITSQINSLGYVILH